ncbi:MAG TPA: hypothetical protein VGF32_23090 [Streptosporangiaceae bacterium]
MPRRIREGGGPTATPAEASPLNAAAEAVSVAALLAVLGWAVIRPRGWPEAAAAVPAAAVVIATGAVSPHAALTEVRRLGPVVAFLAAVLVLAQLCDDEGLFRAGSAHHGQGRRPVPARA